MILTDSNRHVGSHDISVRHAKEQHKGDIVPCTKSFICKLIQNKSSTSLSLNERHVILEQQIK